MAADHNYIEINKKSWNDATPYHISSDFYDIQNFIQGRSSLNSIELDLLGNIEGKTILHLQCHFGQDSISLARLGAKVTGIDFSDKAIDEARKLAGQMGIEIEFICCDIYNLERLLNKKFDIVFTSYGVISWLPDLDMWAKSIRSFLKKDSKFICVEFHPFIFTLDQNFEKIEYRYFNTAPIMKVSNGTYADKNAPIVQETVSWNHSLSEVIGSLIKNGLEIKSFDEFDYSPYNCFDNMIESEPGKFNFKHFENKLPLIFSLVAMKK